MLRRCTLFRTLARGFSSPYLDANGQLERELRRLSHFPGWSEELSRALGCATAAWHGCSSEERAARYARFFATDQRCPLHETAYGDGQRLTGKSAELSDLQGFYRAFGMSLQLERADHLAVELEFYSVLLFKEAWARAERWGEQAAITRSAARQFLADHLARWLGALEAEMARQNVPAPYPELLAAVRVAVREEVQRLHVQVQEIRGRAGGDPMQGERFECPRAGDVRA